MATPENQTAQTVDGFLNAVIMEGAVTAAEAAIKIAVPLLAWPGISQITDFVINYIAKHLYTGLSNYATLQVIAAQTSAEKHEYSQAEFTLRQALLSNDPVAIASAKEGFKAALHKLVATDGWHSPS